METTVEQLKKALEKKQNDFKTSTKIPEFAIHNDTEICGFFSSYRYLSNFWACTIEYKGLIFPNVENAYQSYKYPENQREQFVSITPFTAKKFGKFAPGFNKKEWDSSKYQLMYDLVFIKFFTNNYLKQLLVDTKPKHLEERNNWHDIWWGTDEKGNGQNNLGKILMDVRNKL